MAESWTFTGTPPTIDIQPSLVTLVDGATFCISTSTGNVVPGAPMGLFVHDARVLATWEVHIDHGALEPLAVLSDGPLAATFISRSRPRAGRPESTILITREREVGDGMTETITVRNLANEAAGLMVELVVGTDFADLFEVKEGRTRVEERILSEVVDGALLIRRERDGHSRGTRVVASPSEASAPSLAPGRMTWQCVVGPRADWSCRIVVEALVDDRTVASIAQIEETGVAATKRFREWRIGAPVMSTPNAGLARTLSRSLEDLGALRMRDPRHPDRVGVAAGAPWFMATFGRDSLLTSWMLLPLTCDWPWASCRLSRRPRARATTRSRRRSRGESFTSFVAGRTPLCPWAATAHTSAASTPRRCS